MTLTGRAAARDPYTDMLAPTTVEIVTHSLTVDERGTRRRNTAEPDRADVLGRVDPETGAYRSAANALNETARRELGLRRNGRPRKP